MQEKEIRPFLVVQKFVPIPAKYLEPEQYIYKYGVVLQVLKQKNDVYVLFSETDTICFHREDLLYHRVSVKKEYTDLIKESR